MTDAARPLGLFAAFGVELEYMIVDRETLDVRPLSDRVLASISGEVASEVEVGEIAWSNELVLHVIELKTNGPVPALAPAAAAFAASVARINAVLEEHGACLLGTAMHPWMDPSRDARLWPHEHGAVYAAFDRIFDCRGHGWANLQSTHLNLPFADDEEFGRLHAAVRLMLPILPALAASSPIAGGRAARALDHRLAVYRDNCARVPSVTGLVIPEPVFTRREYEEELLGAIYRDLAPHDPDGVLRHEWVNARGAIARFDRGAIEIRVLDAQECPRADLAVAALTARVVRALVDERWCTAKEQRAFATEGLAAILDDAVRDGERAVIADRGYLQAFGCDGSPIAAGALWRRLSLDLAVGRDADTGPFAAAVALILERGPLARRILRATGPDSSRTRLAAVYRDVALCLARDEVFGG